MGTVRSRFRQLSFDYDDRSPTSKQKAVEAANDNDRDFLELQEAYLRRPLTLQEKHQGHVERRNDMTVMDRILDENWAPKTIDNPTNTPAGRLLKQMGVEDPRKAEWMNMHGTHNAQKRRELMLRYFHDRDSAPPTEPTDRKSSKKFEQLELWETEATWDDAVGEKEFALLQRAKQQFSVDNACPDACDTIFNELHNTRQERIVLAEAAIQAEVRGLESRIEAARNRRAPNVVEAPAE